MKIEKAATKAVQDQVSYALTHGGTMATEGGESVIFDGFGIGVLTPDQQKAHDASAALTEPGASAEGESGLAGSVNTTSTTIDPKESANGKDPRNANKK